MAIGEVLELLQQKDGVADLCQRLHEGAVQDGLKHLALVLAEGVRGTGGLSGWTNSQLQGLVSVTQAVVAACYSLRGSVSLLMGHKCDLKREFFK